MDAICSSQCDLCHSVTQDRGVPSTAFMEKSPEVGLASPCTHLCWQMDRWPVYFKRSTVSILMVLPGSHRIQTTHSPVRAGSFHALAMHSIVQPDAPGGLCGASVQHSLCLACFKKMLWKSLTSLSPLAMELHREARWAAAMPESPGSAARELRGNSQCLIDHIWPLLQAWHAVRS